MAFTAWSYAEMSRVVPHAGSVFAYATAGLGSTAGFFAGWLAMLDYLLIPSVAYLFSGHRPARARCRRCRHGSSPWRRSPPRRRSTCAGVAVAARVGFVVLVVELAVLVVFLVAAGVVLALDGPTRPWLSPLTGRRPPSIARWCSAAVSIAVLSFLGFDAIASFAEENAGDTRAGRAARSALCLAWPGVAFVAQTALAALFSTIAPARLAAMPTRQGTAFYDIARAALGGWLATCWR